jgi:hypothetical protein
VNYRNAIIALIATLLLCGVVCAADCPGGKCPIQKPAPKVGIGGDIGVSFGPGVLSPHVDFRLHYPAYRPWLNSPVQPRYYTPRYYQGPWYKYRRQPRQWW